MTATKCRDCDRPIKSRESQDRERGSRCWREHRKALGQLAKTAGRGRRDWAKDMPGQEELQLEEVADGDL